MTTIHFSWSSTHAKWNEISSSRHQLSIRRYILLMGFVIHPHNTQQANYAACELLVMAAYLKVNLSITNRPSVTCPVITCSSGSTQPHSQALYMLVSVFTIHRSLCHCSITYLLLCIRSNLVQGLVSQTQSVGYIYALGIQPRYKSPSVRWVRTHDHAVLQAWFYFIFILMELIRQYQYALAEHIVRWLL